MRDGFRVLDADRHVLEPSDLFDRYLPVRFRGRVRIEGPNQSRRLVDGAPISDSDRLPGQGREDFGFTFAGSKRWRDTFADALAAGFDPASNVRDMDREGVDLGVLFPTLGLYIMWRDDLDPESARSAATRRCPPKRAGRPCGPIRRASMDWGFRTLRS
jgi:hypothetical protein